MIITDSPSHETAMRLSFDRKKALGLWLSLASGVRARKFSQERPSQIYQCILVVLTLYINALYFLKRKKDFLLKRITYILLLIYEGNIHEILRYVRSRIREKLCTKEKQSH